MEPAIEVRDLTKVYSRRGRDLLAVDRISFSVQIGEVFGFLGPNGAGKSTTQRMLTTLLTPTEGKIRILGHDLVRDAYLPKCQIGLVPEESNVYRELTAWDNLMFTGRLYRMSKTDRVLNAEQLLRDFGLWEMKDVKADRFSKGMKRRLSIAMAVIHKPALLFLDEPTPGLDVQSYRTIQALIRQLSSEGTTVFMTTHQIEEANQLCDRVAIINHGKIAAIDKPEKLKQTFQQLQSVEIAFTPSTLDLEEKLSGLTGVNTVIKKGDKWRLYTDSPSDLFPRLVELSRAENHLIVSLNTLAPSLEDVFLQITGEEISSVGDGPVNQRNTTKRQKGKHL
jgi:ABC-2 type transport system ATP-binding protein